MNASTVIFPGISDPDSPVSWQSIFWTLISLAITAMSQPGGRICGLPGRYRTYLRCSPLLCAADALSIITRLLVSTAYQKHSFTEAVGILLHERFHTSDHAGGHSTQLRGLGARAEELQETQEEGIQSLERMTFLRWAWFLLGTLPPAIKLAAMRGVPYAQAWGYMFLSSWVINEGLIIFATFNQSFFTVSDTGRISWPGFEQTTHSMRYAHVRNAMNVWDGCLATTALIVHVVIINGVFRALWRIEFGSEYPLSSHVSVPGPAYTSIISAGMGVGFGFLMLLPRPLRSSILEIRFFTLTMAASYLMLGNLALNSASYGLVVTQYFSSSISVFGISTVGVLAAMFSIRLLSQRFIMVGRNLHVLEPRWPEQDWVVDLRACLALVLFLATVLACLLWYCYIYDPSSTFNPTWTGVFG